MNIRLLPFFLILCLQVSGQNRYQMLFDSLIGTSELNSTKNTQISFVWGESAHMESLVSMYRATNNLAHLSTLIKCTGNVIDRRDDLRDDIGLTEIINWQGIAAPTWSVNRYNATPNTGPPYAWAVHSGNIIYPMAYLAATIKNDQNLHQLTMPNGGRYGGMNYLNIANEVLARITETLSFHDYQLFTNGSAAWYEIPPNCPLNPNFYGHKLPLNMHSSISRVYVQMYLATNDQYYLNKVNQLANYLKSVTTDDAARQANVWGYWPDLHTGKDDVSHAGLTITLPQEIHTYDLQINGNSIYSDAEMLQYANTFTNGVVRGPLEINAAVDRYDHYWNFKTNVKTGASYSGGHFHTVRWVALADFNQDVYHAVADLYNSPHYTTEIAALTHHRTLAFLGEYAKNFIPVNGAHGFGPASDWAGAGTGQFDTDAAKEWIILRNFSGTFYVYNMNDVTLPGAGSLSYGADYNFTDLTTGNFTGDYRDEVAVYSNSPISANSGQYILTVDASTNTIAEWQSSTGWGSGSNWTKPAAGNFVTNNNYDELIALRNFDMKLRVISSNGTSLSTLKQTDMTAFSGEIVQSMHAANLDADAKDELIILVNSTTPSKNGIFVYDISNTGTPSLLASSVNWPTDMNFGSLTTGDFDNNGIDEIIVHSEKDGDLRIFELQGCGLALVGREFFQNQLTTGCVLGAGNAQTIEGQDELIMLRGSDAGRVVFNSLRMDYMPSFTMLHITACGSYIFNGTTLTTNGTYEQILENERGEDSTVVLYLQIETNPALTIDTDNDNRCDLTDTDDDNDGIPDIVELGFAPIEQFGTPCMPSNPSADDDGDGIPNFKDAQWSICGGLNANGTCISVDTDGDGIPNFHDLDSDNDGINDLLEAGVQDLNGDGFVDNVNLRGSLTTPRDTDNDGIPDFLKLDSDNNGTFDIVNSPNAALDANNNGTVDSNTDNDQDGIMDVVDGWLNNYGDAFKGVLVSLKANLEGPYNHNTDRHNGNLNDSGLLSFTEPYIGLGYNAIGSGWEQISPTRMQVNGARKIVDWVLLELRDPGFLPTVIATRSALLLSNGDIVDLDNNNHVLFDGVPDGNYYIVVRHRNHLDIMTPGPLLLHASIHNLPSHDFTTGMAYGNIPSAVQQLLSNGEYAMVAGDFDGTGAINASDRSKAWNQRNQTGYLLEDANFDGVCNAVDRSIGWNNRNRLSFVP